MRKVKKRSVIDRFNDKINDSIDNIKKKNNDSKNKNKKNVRDNRRDVHNKKDIKKKKQKRSVLKKIITIILILGIVAILSLTAFLGYIVLSAPKFNEQDLDIKEQTIIYDLDGNIITTLAIQNKKREIIAYDELPQVLIDAIIATEDSRFFQHNGVDLLRFIKATLMQLLGKGDAGGASTITMQTVKNRITKKEESEDSRIQKVIRKFQDVYLSVFKIEKQYSKEEILEFYVNDNYLGGGYYGVKEASKYYFGKNVSELTLPEAAMIAGLFQLPDGNNPYKNIDGATRRRNLVLDYMYNHDYITKKERDLAKQITVESLLINKTNNDSEYQGYIDIVIDEVERLTGNSPYKVPMKIYTTMERSIQDGINKIFSNSAWYWKNDDVQSGVAVVNVDTGAVAAVGAGRNKTGARQWNYATQARKQPGSTAKPLFDYGPGIEYNNFSSYTLFHDEPWNYTNGPSVGNWDGKYMGLITLRSALQVSRNIPALKAYQLVGGKNSQKFVYSLGLDVAYNTNSENYREINSYVDNTINEAYAIGGVAEGFTPLEMASAYSGFASGGYYTKSHSVTKIEYRDTGEVVDFKYTKERVMKDSTAYIMNNVLESAVSGGGFAGGARVYGSHVAAKTGTSNFDDATLKKYKLPSYAVNDLWTVAYTSKYSIAVWFGYEEISSTRYNTEGSGKEGLTSAVMSYIPKDTVGWRMPSSVVATEVELETWPAKLPSQYTPKDKRTTEYFVRGTQPTEVSDRFAKLNNVTNLSSTQVSSNTVTLNWDYKVPTVLTEEYINTYFTSSSIFGKDTKKLINERINYNKDKLGDVVFAIYSEDDAGELTLLDTVTENSYTFTGYGNHKLVVVAKHEKFSANASDGVSIILNLGELTTSDLQINLKNTSASYNAHSYTEDGITSIMYGNINITNAATVSYQVNNTTTYNNLNDFVTYINTLPAGSYTIKYTVTYLSYEATRTRTITLNN